VKRSDDFRFEGAGLDGKATVIAAMRAQLGAFPGYSESPTDLEETGDTVHCMAHITRMQQHSLALPGMRPVAPTGRSIRLPPEPACVPVPPSRSY
jgi:hypothetical protein